MRNAKRGLCIVYARLYTHYGTAEEEMKLISIQLKDLKQTTQVGQLEFIKN
ncbi:MAG: hypothetical protein WBG43_01445 [Marinifilaceae bacterium]